MRTALSKKSTIKLAEVKSTEMKSSTSGQHIGLALMSAALALPFAATVQAENAPERGLISFKYLDYLDSQPAAERIRVKTSALSILAPIAGEWAVGGMMTYDGISGASPAYQDSALIKMHDQRRAIETDVTRYLPDGSYTLGASLSKESDYLSRSLSAKGSRTSEDKNTTWSAGISVNNDTIKPNRRIVGNENKRVVSTLLSVTQIMTTHDIVQVNLGYTVGHGYYTDPYKVFDQRPRERKSSTLMTRWNHHIDMTEGTARVSYRYFSDTWGIKAHTLGMEYVQPLPMGWTATPQVRLYSQSAANFYVNADRNAYPFPPDPPENAVYFSEDQRLSAFGAATLGLKLVKQLNADWLVDVKYEHYTQRSSWRLFGTGSPDLLQFNFRSIQLGVSRQF